MWYPLRNYFGDKLVSVFILAQLGVIIVLFIVVASFFKPQDTPALLHYSVDFGVDFVGPWHYIYRIPLIGFVITLVNGFIGYLLYYVERKYTHILLGASAIVVGLLALDLIVILLLNS